MSCSGGIGVSRFSARGNAVPSNSLRAVRTTPGAERRAGARPEASTTTSTSRCPVGCSTSTCEVSGRPVLGELVPDRAGQQHAGDHADRAEHADRGVRLHRDERAGAHLAAVARRRRAARSWAPRTTTTSPSPISAPALRAEGVDPLEQRGVGGQLLVRLVAGQAEGLGERDDDRHAVVDAGRPRRPRSVSRTCPVGSRLPVADPSVSVNASTTGAAVPGTPAIATSPRYSTRPPGVGKVATATLSELTIRIRTLVSPSCAGNQTALHRERPDPGQDVAAVLPVADGRLRRRRAAGTGSRRRRRGAPTATTTATLLVSEVAPPSPSICRGSGVPISRSSRSSRSAGSAGRSPASKYSPREVPPRSIVQRTPVSS